MVQAEKVRVRPYSNQLGRLGLCVYIGVHRDCGSGHIVLNVVLPRLATIRSWLFSVPGFMVLILLIGLAAIFAPESSDPELRHYACRSLDTDSTRSLYVLPFQRGTAHWVNQANCSGRGHSRFWNHGYDFKMDIGTPVIAARSGTVMNANDGCKDGDHACTNLITVRHADGTFALSPPPPMPRPGPQLPPFEITDSPLSRPAQIAAYDIDILMRFARGWTGAGGP